MKNILALVLAMITTGFGLPARASDETQNGISFLVPHYGAVAYAETEKYSHPAHTWLRDAIDQMKVVREQLLVAFEHKMINEGVKNWYPVPAAQKLAVDSDGCHDGWYLIDSPVALKSMGVSLKGMDGAPTALEFCRDYDPKNVKKPDQAPHFAALRAPFPSTSVNRDLLIAYATGAAAQVESDHVIFGF